MWQLEKNIMKMFHVFVLVLINSVGNHVEIPTTLRENKNNRFNTATYLPGNFYLYQSQARTLITRFICVTRDPFL